MAKSDFDAGVSDDLASLESSFTDHDEPAEFDLNLDDDLTSTETEAKLPESFLNDQEPLPDFGSTSFATASRTAGWRATRH